MVNGDDSEFAHYFPLSAKTLNLQFGATGLVSEGAGLHVKSDDFRQGGATMLEDKKKTQRSKPARETARRDESGKAQKQSSLMP
jgi:hypothetical protein